ncbi:branched-chain amino acid ABC transporter permease [Devosia sp.]|uniref:branched-chain amino acid ABC transporter permease n=1 Tax=Devosia sp. TaxID=1871048 RepID=UPI002AFFB2A0|nr:branched-chain amino acid ABC transporter permease [Devosia sp.]
MKLLLALLIFAALAFVPFFADPYPLGLMIGILGYGVLATAWALFSGPTRYISLATVAFFGLGAYSVAVLGDVLPYPLVLVCAAGVGLVLALIVGLATLRLAGIYFVIFTFGLTELVRQFVTYYEVNVTRTLGRYVFLPIGPEHIYWQLLALLAATLAIAWWVSRAKIGLALRVIGDDPVVASHLGIRITRAKLTLFSISAILMSLAGAIQAPRWTYIEPSIVFNPTTSFLVVIMALLGGPNRLLGPLLGAVPLFLLFEWLSANFPNHYSIILGVLFIAIVFLLPNGVLAAFDSLRNRLAGKEARA